MAIFENEILGFEFSLGRTSMFLSDEMIKEFGFDWISLTSTSVHFLLDKIYHPDGYESRAQEWYDNLYLVNLVNIITHPKVNLKLGRFFSLNLGYDADIYIWKRTAFMFSALVGFKLHYFPSQFSDSMNVPYLYYDLGYTKFWSESDLASLIDGKVHHTIGIGWAWTEDS